MLSRASVKLLAGLRDLAEVALLDFDRGVAEHAERLSHSADLVAAIPARDADRRVARGEATHGYRDFLERPDNPWHHVVSKIAAAPAALSALITRSSSLP